jgi:CheY-like chemotaxis protein
MEGGNEIMKKEVVILIAEDDEGHATLIQRNLARAGITNEMIHFKDGQEALDFLFRRGKERTRQTGVSYLLLLDIRMPKVDGVEVLRQLKQDSELRKLPVIMVTTTDDPVEVDRCHEIGCSNYISKPVDYEKFVEAIRQLGLFLSVVEVPKINGTA